MDLIDKTGEIRRERKRGRERKREKQTSSTERHVTHEALCSGSVCQSMCILGGQINVTYSIECSDKTVLCPV